ncbi:uncharacterized protein LOC127789196 [Diospyros lotus]|uniref:uncharacterized protein LOC127789196 n=1 Tax=Diospyros lotus TaxID=55363 RepID=UPI0022527E05|nr:uncharacterized protein LOC127789196 [Diospyros lotus]
MPPESASISNNPVQATFIPPRRVTCCRGGLQSVYYTETASQSQRPITFRFRRMRFSGPTQDQEASLTFCSFFASLSFYSFASPFLRPLFPTPTHTLSGSHSLLRTVRAFCFTALMIQVVEGNSFLPALEDEAIEVECLLVEPKDDHLSVDHILGFDMENPSKCMAIENLPCKFGCLDSDATQKGEDDMKLEVLEVMPCKVGMVEILEAANDASSTCDDYLLGEPSYYIEFAERVPKSDCNSSEALHSGNSGLEHQIPGFGRTADRALGMSTSLETFVRMPECHNDLLENNICKLDGVFGCYCECKTPVPDSLSMQLPTSFDLAKVNQLEEVSDFLEEGVFSSSEKQNDKNLTHGLTAGNLSSTTVLVENIAYPGEKGVEQEPDVKDVLRNNPAGADQIETLLTEKRLRKPTRRYIEESSDLNSRCIRRRCEVSASISEDKFMESRLHRDHDIGSRAMMLVPEESRHDAGSQVQHGSGVCKDHLDEHLPTLGANYENEPSPDDSEDECTTTVRSEYYGGQRKHHRPWKLSEVTRLIEGVSQCGVGKWTAIKRLLFSSSAHRTPVDLKDKWRNLLRASCSQNQRNREDEQNQKHAWQPLPKSVLRRVSELAIIHPYPRDCKAKLSCVRHVSSSTLPLNHRILGTRT